MFTPIFDAQKVEKQRQMRLAGKSPAGAGNVKPWHLLTIAGGTSVTVYIGTLIIEAGYGDQAYAILCMFVRHCP